jgi:sialate O-acetylesterase
MKNRTGILATLVSLLVLTVSVFADGTRAETGSLKLPAIFGDNMVLQQRQAVPIWGWAAPGAKVTVRFAGQAVSTHADKDGRWRVKLKKLDASFIPQSLVVESGETQVFTNILVGEVWLCSGQSNMEKPIGNQPGQKPCFNAPEELAAGNYPDIRLFKIEKVLSATALDDLKQFRSWRACDSNSLESTKFSAAGYFFGREIHTNLNVPVGLIESSWGGTRIEPWTPPVGFESVHSLAKLAKPPSAGEKIRNTTPMAIYNAMIAPIAGFALRGTIWYQGESNCMGTNDDHDYLTYADKMKAMVGGWRKIWNEGDFPFYFVQISPFKYYSGKVRRTLSPETLPEFWTIQSRAARTIKNTGMVVTTDLVNDLDDIHPRDKQDVGHRLALLARKDTYGEDLVASGPVFKRMKIEGDKVVLQFDHVDGGLMSKGGPLSWFTIAGADGKFVPADASIVGDTVEVSASAVAKPAVVRFAWDETAQPNFFNQAGLPAEPFQTSEPRQR